MDLLLELRARIAGLAGGARRRPLGDGLSVGVLDECSEPAGGFTGPSLTVVAEGVKRTILNGRDFDYRAGQNLVASLDLPVVGYVIEAPFAAFTMTLEPPVIAGLLLESREPRSAPTHLGLVVGERDDELIDPVVRLLRLTDRPDDLRVLGPGIRREIVWRLLRGDQGPVVRQIGRAGGSLIHIARTIRWIRDHYDEPFRADELAALAGMSLSSFHRHFRDATSMTPLQFQKQIRLQEARALLRARPGDVTEVSHLVGYESPSQFSREYRRLFGAPPSADLARPAPIPS